jgi:hypothetical protein
MLLSMPFWLMKGQSRLSQGIVLGPAMLLILLATYVAARL